MLPSAFSADFLIGSENLSSLGPEITDICTDVKKIFHLNDEGGESVECVSLRRKD